MTFFECEQCQIDNIESFSRDLLLPSMTHPIGGPMLRHACGLLGQLCSSSWIMDNLH